jgi:hypothetical protein
MRARGFEELDAGGTPALPGFPHRKCALKFILIGHAMRAIFQIY